MGAHPVHLQICVLFLRRAYKWYRVCVGAYNQDVAGSGSIPVQVQGANMYFFLSDFTCLRY